MQAIQTKYQSATNSRSARVSATCETGRLSIAWDDELDTEGNHRAAAAALIDKLQWGDMWIGGGLKDGSYVFVHCASLPRIDSGVQG